MQQRPERLTETSGLESVVRKPSASAGLPLLGGGERVDGERKPVFSNEELLMERIVESGNLNFVFMNTTLTEPPWYVIRMPGGVRGAGA